MWQINSWLWEINVFYIRDINRYGQIRVYILYIRHQFSISGFSSHFIMLSSYVLPAFIPKAIFFHPSPPPRLCSRHPPSARSQLFNVWTRPMRYHFRSRPSLLPPPLCLCQQNIELSPWRECDRCCSNKRTRMNKYLSEKKEKKKRTKEKGGNGRCKMIPRSSGKSWITNSMFLFGLFVHGVINHDPVFILRCSFIKLIIDSGLRVKQAVFASVQTVIKWPF